MVKCQTEKKQRKKMIDVKVPRELVKRLMMYADEFRDNSFEEEDIKFAMEDKTTLRLWLRRGEPRDREMRSVFPIKKKEYHRWGW